LCERNYFLLLAQRRTQFFYAFFSAFSGQTCFDDYYVNFFNLVFTSVPLLFKALLERDFIDIKDEYYYKEDTAKYKYPEIKNFVTKHLPYTYYIGRESTIFSIKNFLKSILFSFIHSVIIFYAIYFYMNKIVMTNGGYVADLWTISVTQFTAIILNVNFNLLVSQRHHTQYNIWIIIITSYVVYILYMYVSSQLTYSNTYSSVEMMFSFSQYYLSVFLIGFISFLSELFIASYLFNFEDNSVTFMKRFIHEADEIPAEEIINTAVETSKKIIEYDDMMRPLYKVKRVVIPPEI